MILNFTYHNLGRKLFYGSPDITLFLVTKIFHAFSSIMGRISLKKLKAASRHADYKRNNDDFMLQ